MSDNLDTLSNAQLNEAFGAEVAEYTRSVGDYCEDSNAVLQWLDECVVTCKRVCGDDGFPEKWRIEVDTGAPNGIGSAEGSTFARVAVTALIRSKRAVK